MLITRLTSLLVLAGLGSEARPQEHELSPPPGSRVDELIGSLSGLVDPGSGGEVLFAIAAEARHFEAPERRRIVAAITEHEALLRRRIEATHPALDDREITRILEGDDQLLPLLRACRAGRWILDQAPTVDVSALETALRGTRGHDRHAALWVLWDEPALAIRFAEELAAMVAGTIEAGDHPAADPVAIGTVDGPIGWSSRRLAARIAVRSVGRPELRRAAVGFLLEFGQGKEQIEALREVALLAPEDPLLRFRVLRCLQRGGKAEQAAALAALASIGVPPPAERLPSREAALAELRRGATPERAALLRERLNWYGPTDEDALRILDKLAADPDQPRMAAAAARLAERLRTDGR